MKLYDMLVMHDKNLGTQGDCLRACLATLLQRDPETMPNFASDPQNPNWIFSMNIYLQQFGLWFVMVPNTGLSWHSSAGGVHHMLIGDTIRGTHHAVVARNGYMIHDPHPSRMGLINGGSWNENLKAGLLVTKGQM